MSSDEWNAVNVKFGLGTTRHRSLGHLWNDWYGEYFYNNYTKYDNDEQNKAMMNGGNISRKENGNNEKETAPFPRFNTI